MLHLEYFSFDGEQISFANNFCMVQNDSTPTTKTTTKLILGPLSVARGQKHKSCLNGTLHLATKGRDTDVLRAIVSRLADRIYICLYF